MRNVRGRSPPRQQRETASSCSAPSLLLAVHFDDDERLLLAAKELELVPRAGRDEDALVVGRRGVDIVEGQVFLDT